MVYHDWLLNWLETVIKPTRKQSTYELYCRIVRKYVAPALGSYAMTELSTDDVQQFYSDLTAILAPNTVLNVMSVVKSSLKRANVVGIAEKRCHEVHTPRPRPKEVECFTRAEQKIIEDFVANNSDNKLFGITLCLYTGLRIGELLALKWSDIDFRSHTITVRKTCRDSWKNGRYVKLFDTPKTRSSARVIPLRKAQLTALAAIKKQSKSEFVISDKNGKNVSVRSYQKTFSLILQKTGIKHRGFHTLRHTFATRAVECGVDVKVVAEVMGHENPMLTLKLYTHALTAHKVAMMNKLDNVFKNE